MSFALSWAVLSIVSAMDAGAGLIGTTDVRTCEVGPFVAAWLATQNEGRFDDYARLYAPEFVGVRRSSHRQVELDRRGWLADRGRMFKKRMQVKIDAVRVLSKNGTIVELGFNQEFMQGTYHDHGPKRLRVRCTEEGPLIQHEEMLSSEILRQTLPAIPLPLAIDGCPGEHCNCVSSDRLRADAELHERLDVASPVILRLKANTRVQNIAFKQVVVRPGLALTKDGKAVYFLGYAAEGYCLIHDGRKLAQAHCEEELDVEDARVVGESWIAIQYKNSVGYTMDDSAVEHGHGKGCVFGGQ